MYNHDSALKETDDWMRLNYTRMHVDFAPGHDANALILCIGQEIGELCAAALGESGEKKRKAHLTAEHVLDACADAFTYLALLWCTRRAQQFSYSLGGSIRLAFEVVKKSDPPSEEKAVRFAAIQAVLRNLKDLQYGDAEADLGRDL